MGDWLGTGKIAYQMKNHRPFAEVREFVRSLKLKSQKEWILYCQGKLDGYGPKPKDIPTRPNTIYKDQGWQGWDNCLGIETKRFQEARDFVRNLNLKNVEEWCQYCKGELKNYAPRPKYIPGAPHRTYKDQGWQGMGDWLGTGVLGGSKQFRSFQEARDFVRFFKLKGWKEWKQYCQGKLDGYDPKPKDIPTRPNIIYKDQGWQDMGDWLGTGVLGGSKQFRSFQEARDFVRSFKLKGWKEWKRYCQGKLDGYDPKPKDIPTRPNTVYKDKGWQGIGDWLGTGVLGGSKQFRSFQEARDFVRSLKLKGYKEWKRYCQGKLDGYDPKPKDIPTSPHTVYKDKGWQATGNWLGIEPKRFQEARDFVRNLNLKNVEEWYQYCKGELRNYAPRPKYIPSAPHRTYKDQGWQGMGDWLGTGVLGGSKQFRSFQEARDFVRSLKLKGWEEWKWYCQGKLDGYDPKPKDIPTSPNTVYKDQGWQGMRDWLGTGVLGGYKQFRSFIESRDFVRSLKLKGYKGWKRYCQGKLDGYDPKPKDIPASPNTVYKDQGWQGMGDWLARGVSSGYKQFRSFQEARDFVRSLKLKSYKEWRRYYKGTLHGYDPKPKDIPTNPNTIYKDQGWQGIGDWLGN